MHPFVKGLLYGGTSLLAAGLYWYISGCFFHMGKLPGDLVFVKNHVYFYFPLMSTILLSLFASVILGFLRLFRLVKARQPAAVRVHSQPGMSGQRWTGPMQGQR
ncbi:DUF2905 domain-containing protein [Paenibacillus sp. CC-CFT747]|nr:DUF2905 domain-containing protein [Paenibacillus sp. CC-CFT747]